MPVEEHGGVASPEYAQALPQDIPWRQLAWRGLPSDYIALGTRADSALEDILFHVGVGSSYLTTAGNLGPSLGMFYYPVPLAETETLFPGERIVCLKIAATLSGMMDLPCVGGIVDIALQYRDHALNEWSRDRAYVRDVYPKSQESIVNELIGSESLERSNSSVSSTRTWNVSASVSAGFGGIGASVSASADVALAKARRRVLRLGRLL